MTDKTAEQVIADEFSRVGFDGADTAKSMVRFLRDAGFVILPIEPTEQMTATPAYQSGEWSRRNYASMMRSAIADEFQDRAPAAG